MTTTLAKPPEGGWLGSEATRNRSMAPVYTAIIKRAYGCDFAVLIGHHLCYQQGSDIMTEDEVPAADSLIFNVPMMAAVFGEADALALLPQLAVLSRAERDELLTLVYTERFGDPGEACYCEAEPNDR